jgi:hypothetical protein
LDASTDGSVRRTSRWRLLWRRARACGGGREAEQAGDAARLLLPLEGLAVGGDDDGAAAKLRHQQTKIQGAPNTILVDRDVVAIVRAQRQWALEHLRAHADDAQAQPRYLFLSPWRNRHGRRPYSVATLNGKLAKLGQRIDIRDGQGRPVALTPTRRFRHTKATSLLNAGVPARRAPLPRPPLPRNDDAPRPTLQQTHEREFLRFNKVTADGRDLELDPRNIYDRLELAKRADRSLPNGLCLLPPRQVCDRANACLTATSSRPTPPTLASTLTSSTCSTR